MGQIDRKKRRLGGQVDLSRVPPELRSMFQGYQNQIEDLQEQIDALTKVTYGLENGEDPDFLSPRVRKLERLLAERVKVDRALGILTDRKVSQLQIAALPTDAAQGDYITAYNLGVYGDGSASGETVKVAKPYHLRRGVFDGNTVNGVAYAYSDNYTRTADGVSQTVFPAYNVGDTIYAIYQPSGGTGVLDENSKVVHWLDANMDGRVFESLLSSAVYNSLELTSVLNSTTVNFANTPILRRGNQWYSAGPVSNLGSITTTTYVGLRVYERYNQTTVPNRIRYIGGFFSPELVNLGASPFITTSNGSDFTYEYPLWYDIPIALVTCAGSVITTIDQIAWGFGEIPIWRGTMRAGNNQTSVWTQYASGGLGNGLYVLTPGASQTGYIFSGLSGSTFTVQIGFSGLTDPLCIGYVETDGSGYVTTLYDYTVGMNTRQYP